MKVVVLWLKRTDMFGGELNDVLTHPTRAVMLHIWREQEFRAPYSYEEPAGTCATSQEVSSES